MSPNNMAQQLLRKHLRTVTPYASARRSMSGGRIWLNANESPYSREYQITTDNLNRYPNFQSSDLNRAYANYAGVDAGQLLSHRGSDESIELLIRSFCEPGQDSIMICPPTYGMYAISASLNNTPVTAVPLLQDHDEQRRWQLDIDAIKANSNHVKVVFLCHPANPLGNLLDPRDIETVLAHFAGNALVVVDEAYIEYALQQDPSVSFAARIDEFENLVVMRTLSKAFGLAGIRVGFTLANRDIIHALVPVLAPYPLPDVSIQVATQALNAENLIEMRQNVFEAVTEREMLATALRQLEYVQRVEASSTNFILIQVTDADALMGHCLAASILLRNQSAQVGLDNCIRITVGAPAENEQLMDVLQAFTPLA